MKNESMDRNNLYPIFLKVSNLQTLIVGGGNVGLEKLTFLLRSSPDARVTVLSKDFHPELEKLAKDFQVELIQGSYEESYLNNKNIVIAATDEVAVNEKVYHDCRARQILVNVADNPPFCDFYMGGIVTKGNLKIAISTNGKSPTTAKRLRQFFEEFFPENTNDLLDNLNTYRKTLKGNFEEKVNALNELTKVLIFKNETRSEKFQKAIKLIDEANKKDPNNELGGNKIFPKEYLYSVRMTEVLEQFYPNPSEELQLAVRAQHICRWEIPRDSYPMDRPGYLNWRKDLKDLHAQKARVILTKAGYQESFITKVESLIKKKQLKRNKETQVLEDVACLVFLKYYFEAFAGRSDDDKVIGILRKTWAKMSEDGRKEALKIQMRKELLNLVEIATATGR